ncbi:MAG: hypothetical protein E7L01_09675 [Paenibacillus macerans]|uniref:hypothetical protein n=1 Tax=Paenibacillus macerans TaxID=44252 RepID=UPI001F0E5A5A|nr:hypothetical protein [Paenibacillus macerans]MDU5947303.1 hypothetical protein [Paenibacillus macerans]MDU7473594.1 hypothetical protein [Paenibacillus macerans]MEC0139178.1 hypothetical protein [Paenibacillus macerans]UMV47259.1 hypothetical protein LMZ02_28035 [Paenibacillus macerans]
MNNLPEMSSIARMYEVLAHIKSFPAPIRPVAIMSGMKEEDIRDLITPSLYTIIDGYIQHTNALKYLESLTVGDADFLNCNSGLAVYCKDGRPVWLHVDADPDDEGPPSRLYMLALALGVSALGVRPSSKRAAEGDVEWS